MIKKLIILIIFAQFFISCDADFSPYGEFNEKYIVTCILRSDTTFQTAVLSHSYLPNNPDPNTYNIDPSIMSADIRVWYKDSVYVFKDTSVIRNDTSRYQSSYRFYFNNKFRIQPREEIEIEVLLQNGRRLHASSFTPSDIRFEESSEVIIPPVNSNLVQFSWENQNQGTYFSPKFEIKYSQIVNGITEIKKIEVPLRYENKNGEIIPVYPDHSTRTVVVYPLEVITQALESISDSDPNKQNYYIYQTPIINVLAFDDALSRYASSTSASLSESTVILNSSDYTNIENGFGIFGSFVNKKYTSIKFQESYINSFGYNFIFDSN